MKPVMQGSVKELALREALTRGWHMEILCRTDPVRSTTNWTGEWCIRTVTEDGSVAMDLVTQKETRAFDADPRVFKTSTGLISFLRSFDMDVAILPLKAGTWARLPRPGDQPDFIFTEDGEPDAG